MTDSEIFDRFCQQCKPKIGFRYIPTNRLTPEQYARSFGFIKNMAYGLIGSARSFNPRLPPIYVDFIFNPYPNAYAFKHEGRYFIAMTTGLVFMADFLFARMLCDARILPHIGNPSVEHASFPPLNYTLNAQSLARLHPGRPKDDKRYAYMANLEQILMLYVIGHELAHISRGHVDYRDATTGNSIISIIPSANRSLSLFGLTWNPPADKNLFETQVLELDADIRSVHCQIASAKETCEFVSANRASLDPKRCERVSVSDLLFDFSFATNTFFRMLGDIEVDIAELPKLDHPPSPIRRMIAINAAQYIVKDLWKPSVDLDEAILSLRFGAALPEEVFDIITGKTSSRRGMEEAFGQDGVDYFKHLYGYLINTLGPELAKHSYEPLMLTDSGATNS